MSYNLNVAASFPGVGSSSQSPRLSTTSGLPRDPFLPMVTNTSWEFDGGNGIAAEATKNWKSASTISAQLLAPVNTSVAQLKSPITLYDNQELSSTKRGRKRRDPWSKEVRKHLQLQKDRQQRCVLDLLYKRGLNSVQQSFLR